MPSSTPKRPASLSEVLYTRARLFHNCGGRVWRPGDVEGLPSKFQCEHCNATWTDTTLVRFSNTEVAERFSVRIEVADAEEHGLAWVSDGGHRFMVCRPISELNKIARQAAENDKAAQSNEPNYAANGVFQRFVSVGPEIVGGAAA